MIKEERVKQLFKIALYEQNEEKQNRPINIIDLITLEKNS